MRRGDAGAPLPRPPARLSALRFGLFGAALRERLLGLLLEFHPPAAEGGGGGYRFGGAPREELLGGALGEPRTMSSGRFIYHPNKPTPSPLHFRISPK